MDRARSKVARWTVALVLGALAALLAGWSLASESAEAPTTSAQTALTGPTAAADVSVSTYSVVGYCPATKSWGVATQSRFLAVGSVVPWAKAGVGAVATQAYANPEYGPEGLASLATGTSAEDVVRAPTSVDARRALRQVGIVDAQGGSATYTGAGCSDIAAGAQGTHCAVQGTLLASDKVVPAMRTAFERDPRLPLADRLMAALHAAQAEGGDRRGQQSAAILVVRAGAGYGGTDRFIDLRVDDHAAPLGELARLLILHRALWPKAHAAARPATAPDPEPREIDDGAGASGDDTPAPPGRTDK